MNLIGHKKQWNNLSKAREAGRLSHAYLFSGIKQIGKRTFGLELVKLINCESPTSNQSPCRKCRNCEMIEKGSFNDFFLVESKSDTKPVIKISQIRELQNFLSYRPSVGKIKAAIIDNVEVMTNSAQGCLLKTLEEPPGNSLLILVSSQPETLLPTIYSRCEVVKFSQVSSNEIKDYLASKNISEEKANLLTNLSQGKAGKALNLLEDPDRIKKEKEILKEISDIYNADIYKRFDYIKKLTSKNSSIDLKDFFEILTNYLRFVLLKKAGADNFLQLESFYGSNRKLKQYDLSKLKNHIEQVEQTKGLIFSTNVSSKLALETLMVNI